MPKPIHRTQGGRSRGGVRNSGRYRAKRCEVRTFKMARTRPASESTGYVSITLRGVFCFGEIIESQPKHALLLRPFEARFSTPTLSSRLRVLLLYPGHDFVQARDNNIPVEVSEFDSLYCLRSNVWPIRCRPFR